MANPKQRDCLYDRLMNVLAPALLIAVLVGLPLKLWVSNPDGFWRSSSPSSGANECAVVGIAERCY